MQGYRSAVPNRGLLRRCSPAPVRGRGARGAERERRGLIRGRGAEGRERQERGVGQREERREKIARREARGAEEVSLFKRCPPIQQVAERRERQERGGRAERKEVGERNKEGVIPLRSIERFVCTTIRTLFPKHFKNSINIFHSVPTLFEDGAIALKTFKSNDNFDCFYECVDTTLASHCC
jgi:hypothetical protein